MPNEAINKLQQLRLKAETTKDEMNRLEGQRDSLLDRLKNEFNLNSIEEAKAEISTISKQVDELNLQVKELVQTLEKAINLE